MVRVVAQAGRVVVGRTLPGRGAWLHPGCLEAALKRRALPRALRAPGVSTEGLAEAVAAEAGSGRGASR
ncbi:YlxR family protein [Propioniciclava coleopterorum]|uniref:YlxR family protein n=2 Tax=Propioniciclava coleopterorum TaxID=2714937 RepID=A0A6G7YBI8_9ACTN|nr:YlxR family protein [Propioniciclava coleopterorum]